MRWKLKITSIYALIYHCVLLSIGTSATFAKTLVSGFMLLQTDKGDTRFNNYLMEHSYQWLMSFPHHDQLWNMPIFYPLTNTFAYSDVLLGVAPIYWIYRTIFQPDTSYQLWQISICVLNYVTFFIFLRYMAKLTHFASGIGAYIFTFSIPRIAQMLHPQLIPGFFIVASFCGLYGYLYSNSKHTNAYLALFAGGIILQFYTGFYMAWMWCLFLLFIFLIIFIVPPWRQKLFFKMKTDLSRIGWLIIVAAVVMFPLVFHYIQAYQVVPPFKFSEDITYIQPRLTSWMYPGLHSIVYSKFSSAPIFDTAPHVYELVLFLGCITTAAILLGALYDRQKSLTKLMIWTSIIIMMTTTKYPNNFSVWEYIYTYVPGAQAIRSLGRFILILLIPYSYWVAVFIHSQQKKRSRIVILLFSSLLIMEQFSTTYAYNKINIRSDQNMIASAIPRDCKYFFYISNRDEQPWKAQIDAIWAGAIAKKQTINGYSSWSPLDAWNISHNIARNMRDVDNLVKGVNGWIEHHSIPKIDTCIIYGRKVIQ